ncbi:MAG: hypothetical protein ACTSWN_10720 [Promethearchaeota archaeon]
MNGDKIPDFIKPRIQKRDEYILKAQELYKEGRFKQALEMLQKANEVCRGLKDKDMQRKIQLVIKDVEKKIDEKFTNMLIDSFKRDKTLPNQKELMEVFLNLIEIMLNGFFNFESQINEMISKINEKLLLGEVVNEEMAKEIGMIKKRIDDLAKNITASVKTTAQEMTVIKPPYVAPTSKNAMKPTPPGLTGPLPPGISTPAKHVHGPPSLPPGAPAGSATGWSAGSPSNPFGSSTAGPPPPPGAVASPPPPGSGSLPPPPPGSGSLPPPPPGSSPSSPPRIPSSNPPRKIGPVGPISVKGGLMSELQSVLAKRRQKLNE